MPDFNNLRRCYDQLSEAVDALEKELQKREDPPTVTNIIIDEHPTDIYENANIRYINKGIMKGHKVTILKRQGENYWTQDGYGDFPYLQWYNISELSPAPIWKAGQIISVSFCIPSTVECVYLELRKDNTHLIWNPRTHSTEIIKSHCIKEIL